MREVTETKEHLQLFELLFYASIKVKEGMKFEENMNLLFGKHAYLFLTIYRLFDCLIKSVLLAAVCPLTSYSLRIMEQEQSEELYLLLVNRFCLMNGLGMSKIVRLTFDKDGNVIYTNYLDCYYKGEDLNKDLIKKRSEIARGV